MTLDRLNCASGEEARDALLPCCGSEAWVEEMLSRRPFHNLKALHDIAEAIWRSLPREEWLSAFSRHPKVGEKPSSNWSAQEQRGMSAANSELLESMGALNAKYERTFGWIFIVCATGKPAEQMLGLLQQRLSNDPEEELLIAAAEHAKIMHIRLDKLLAE